LLINYSCALLALYHVYVSARDFGFLITEKKCSVNLGEKKSLTSLREPLWNFFTCEIDCRVYAPIKKAQQCWCGGF